MKLDAASAMAAFGCGFFLAGAALALGMSLATILLLVGAYFFLVGLGYA